MDLTDMQLLASAAFVSYDILLQSGMLQLPYIPIIKIYFSLEVHWSAEDNTNWALLHRNIWPKKSELKWFS